MVVTKAEFLFMIQSVNLPPSAHPAHTAAVITSSVHLQCTHTAAVITSSVHTAANLQCTFEPPHGKPIPLLANLQNSQQTLMVDYSSPYDEEDWLIIAVQDVNE